MATEEVTEDVLTVVGWLWKSPHCQNPYKPEHANTWARMLHRNLTIPHRFVLLTDQPDAHYDPLIEPVPLWDDWRTLKNAEWDETRPNCYVRLKAFSREAESVLGKRFVSVDLDCVALDKPLDDLFTRKEDFVIYHRPTKKLKDRMMKYQGSMWMLRAGARAQVWEDFHGEPSVKAAREFIGTDQAWIRHKLGPDEAGWTENDGVYGWYWLGTDPNYTRKPPANAKLIFFNTAKKPWDFKLGAPVDEVPRCSQCQAPIKVEEPWSLSLNKGQAPETHRWVAKYYQ